MYELREATEEDIISILGIDAAKSNTFRSRYPTDRDILSRMADGNTYYIANDGENDVGYVSMHANQNVKLNDIAVNSLSQRKGVGSVLVGKVVIETRELGKPQVMIDRAIPRDVRGFFEKQGFEQIKTNKPGKTLLRKRV